MHLPYPYRFWQSGPAEYVLVKAGLFRVIDLSVSPADALTRLLDPLPDALLPTLVRMAEICALELGGAIDTGDRRARAVGELRELGLPHAAIGDLFQMIAAGAAATAQERRDQPKGCRL
jgi:hypothetical protein